MPTACARSWRCRTSPGSTPRGWTRSPSPGPAGSSRASHTTNASTGAGGFDPAQPHYYRVQGPTFLIEYDDTQNEANHIHTVWRDFKDDFGEELLKRPYEQEPHGAGAK